MLRRFLHTPLHARALKRPVAIAVDGLMLLAATWLAFSVRLEGFHRPQGMEWAAYGLSLALALPAFGVVGLYRSIVRFSGVATFLAIAKGVGLYALVFSALLLGLRLDGVPRSLSIIQPLLALLFVASWRLAVRVWYGRSTPRHGRAPRRRVAIYGAGGAGRRLLAALQNSHEMIVVAFLDDQPQLRRSLINGVTIFDPHDLPDLVRRGQVDAVLLAIPSLSRKRRNEILDDLRASGVHVRTLPGLIDLAKGTVRASDLRELDIEDLLGRDPVQPRSDLMARHTSGKVVLVTGAGGSIGSELCRQLAALHPDRLVLVEQSEFALYCIHQELLGRMGDGTLPRCALEPVLCSVRDTARIGAVMRRWRPHIVYHAAAYKHVPLVECNVVEGVANNVLGTWLTAQAACDAGVPRFVLISTDKAVRPSNVMGASKRMAEMVLQAMATQAAEAVRTDGKAVATTCFSMVRFGNVLGSSGSVVPLFRQQIRNGGPITVTHPDVTRFFMTIPEAAQLVVQAGAMAQGGEVFVLDMGQPVRIIDLARRMVELSGLTVRDAESLSGDIEITVTGLRPGEKLYEELLIGDNPLPTDHPRIMMAREGFLPFAELHRHLLNLQALTAEGDAAAVVGLLRQLVNGYVPPAGEWTDNASQLQPAAEFGSGGAKAAGPAAAVTSTAAASASNGASQQTVVALRRVV
ncbi:MAG TPA: nucleoside-diphosphate sugar epimerase/dehydratase [Aquabacterium sp.]|nr:nucleoside-diphosphate sugar epimerase/dehydratase [Aquabacterium sp.]HQC94752.1 nucleoside-diphosphate sugar epimerase/dehydratase [Aquabacterium sp.]